MTPPRPLRALRVLALGLAMGPGAVGAQPSTADGPAGAALGSFEAVHDVFLARDEARYDAATEAYLRLLDTADAEAARQPLARLALILPPDLAADAVRDVPGVRQRVSAWWRAADPLPATPRNERAVEHNLRVATAARSFTADTPTGFDARGEVFVRFGAPMRRRVIDFESDLFIARAIRDEPAVRRSDFPRNEAWHYPALGPDVYFLFIEERGAYREGTTTDLLPRALQAGGLNAETEGRARLLGRALRWIYKDLYVYSDDIRRRLLVLDGTVGGDGVAFSGNTGLAIQNEMQRARMEDDIARQERDDGVPPGASRIGGRPARIEARAVAFQDGPPADPTSAVWVGWSQPTDRLRTLADSLGELGIQPDAFLLDVAAVRYGPAYERDRAAERRFLVDVTGTHTEPQWTAVEGVEAGGHVAIQWSLTPAGASGSSLLPGPIAVDVLRVDSVRWGGGGMGLSGLLPVDPAGALATLEADRFGAMPPAYPFAAVRSGEPIAVYYEVYGRDLGAEVTLEVRAVRVRRGQLFRPGQDVATATASTFTLDEARRPELAVLDAPDLGDADEVRVEVTLTRTDSGERVVQAVTFAVAR